MSGPHDSGNLPDGPLLSRRNAFVDRLSAHPTVFQVAIWSVVVGSIITGLVLYFTGQLKAENAGYAGVFLINLVGSASIVVPVPGLAAACGAAAPSVSLIIPVLALAGAGGSTIGEVTGYLAGYGGQSFIQKSRYYDTVQRWVMRRGAIALFVLAAVPTPFFDIAGIASGSLGYPLRRFLLWVFLGKIIKFVLIGYACYHSIDWLTDLIRL